jgi:hypothetical protein
MPDPNPGRCLCVRQVAHPDGYLESLRCLDYEGRRHTCTFPNPTHVTSLGSTSSVYRDTGQAEPWVRPE